MFPQISFILAQEIDFKWLDLQDTWLLTERLFYYQVTFPEFHVINGMQQSIRAPKQKYESFGIKMLPK